MKVKKIQKKLVLGRKTIANLDQSETRMLVGGGDDVNDKCPGPVCGSGSAYDIWLGTYSCPPFTQNSCPHVCAHCIL